jgi:hypothetical protein
MIEEATSVGVRDHGYPALGEPKAAGYGFHGLLEKGWRKHVEHPPCFGWSMHFSPTSTQAIYYVIHFSSFLIWTNLLSSSLCPHLTVLRSGAVCD